MNKEIIEEILSGKYGEAKEGQLLKDYTTMRVGGEADIMVFPTNIEEVTNLVKYTKAKNIPLTIIGNGSNLLVRDKGIRGIVLAFKDNFSEIKVDGNKVKALSGALLRNVAIKSFESNLTGMEPVSGIPGSLGGAIIMNAGAYGTEMKDIVESVLVMDSEANIIELSNEEMNFSYRNSIAEEKHYIVLEATFSLKEGNKEEIYEEFEKFDYLRSSRQPLDKNSAGSTFKRPEGYFASKLIDESGLRGFTIGRAQVSEKHTGFLINMDNASCENMLELISEVQKIIFEKHGVRLEREVKLIGEE